jgi:hypothetical protein
MVCNQVLDEKIKILEQDSKFEHHGKAFGEVSNKQQLRVYICSGKLSRIRFHHRIRFLKHCFMSLFSCLFRHDREKASTALWFAKYFNLLPISLELRENTTNKHVVVDLNRASISITPEPPQMQ